MQAILEDKPLWDEYQKAYHMASRYREQVQFRKDLICMPGNYIGNVFIYNENTDTVLINAGTQYVCEDLGG
jgi:hypothetical protein